VGALSPRSRRLPLWRRAALAVTAVTAVVACAVAACTGDGAATGAPPARRVVPDRPLRVAFFGDSIAVEAEPEFARLMQARGAEYRFDGYGGTATCDYLDEMRATAASFDPDVVVLLFTGNALTPCMLERTGGGLAILGERDDFDLPGYTRGYREDTATAIETFGPDVHVVLVGVLPTGDGRTAAAQVVDDLYRDEASRRPNVGYVLPSALLTSGGEFATDLPCAQDEPCRDGDLVPVRAEDGAHLCPRTGFCYGGLRMARSIDAAVGAVVGEEYG
jgi:hypothetical protein